MFSSFKKRFLVQILLDILRPVAIRFLSRIVHGNCLFDELVNLKSVFWWVGTSAEHNHLFLISKTKQPNHRKIDPQLVTGTTCYLHTPFTYLSTLGHLIGPNPGDVLEALVVHQVTENFLPEGPVTIGITSGAWLGSEGSGFPHQWRSAWVVTLVGWKRDSNKTGNGWSKIWGTNFGGMRKRWQLL